MQGRAQEWLAARRGLPIPRADNAAAEAAGELSTQEHASVVADDADLADTSVVLDDPDLDSAPVTRAG